MRDSLLTIVSSEEEEEEEEEMTLSEMKEAILEVTPLSGTSERHLE
jgi:hypothetical protein